MKNRTQKELMTIAGNCGISETHLACDMGEADLIGFWYSGKRRFGLVHAMTADNITLDLGSDQTPRYKSFKQRSMGMVDYYTNVARTASRSLVPDH